MLEIKNLSASVGDKPILKNLSLTVPPRPLSRWERVRVRAC
jgi:Fe-S cluster assembly ATPase SufC